MSTISAPVGVVSFDFTGQKLRSSCDYCGSSKVKCDRQKPQCGRCTTLKLLCVYGPSQKFGKPPRKRLTSDMSLIVQKRPCLLRSISHSQEAISSRRSAKPTQPDTSEMNKQISDPESNLELHSTLAIQDQFTSDLYPSLLFEEWPQIDELDQIGQWQESGNWQFAATDFHLEVPSSTFPLDTINSSHKNAEESHSCARDSYEIFRDLVCPSSTLHAPKSNSSTVSAPLDQVLQFNRKAIERLTHQAAGWTGSSSWGPLPPILVDSSASSERSQLSPRSPCRTPSESDNIASVSLVQTTGFSVEHAPVVIGDFSIEDQNVQGAFRNQLVLSELKKTANLIEIFISITPCPEDTSGSGLSGLYQSLGMWLQGEYARTVSTLKHKLKVLNESVGS